MLRLKLTEELLSSASDDIDPPDKPVRISFSNVAPAVGANDCVGELEVVGDVDSVGSELG